MPIRLLVTAAVVLALTWPSAAASANPTERAPSLLPRAFAPTLSLDSPRARGCPRWYRAGDFWRYARKTFPGRSRPTTRFQRQTLDRVIRCQRRARARANLRKARRGYHRALVVRVRQRRVRETAARLGENRSIGYLLLYERGLVDQWPCLDQLNDHESGWDHTAVNPTSGALGIPQSLPGWKMGEAGADYRTNPRTQLRWQIDHYILPRYGSPCAAWAFWLAHRWY